MSDYIVKAEAIVKAFPGMKALDDVDFKVKRGTVHALMGENGAGKSTLMKIFQGFYHADSGRIIFNDEEVRINNPHEALTKGIAMVHQELANLPERNVAENIFLGREIKLKGFPLLDNRAMIAETQKIFSRLNISIDPTAKMSSLSVAKQQLCEIAKAVSYDAKLVIMDEPTSALTEEEVKNLFDIVRKLKEQGVSIVYITHRMEEVYQIADEVTVLRDGKFINTVKTSEVKKDELITMMVGREIKELFPKQEAEIGEEKLRVENLSHHKLFSDVSFTLRKGEILGIAGLVGSGRSEVMETLFGIRRMTSGKIFIDNKEVKITKPMHAISYKMGFLTEDRKKSGCFPGLGIDFNLYIAAIKEYAKRGIILKKKVCADSCDMIKLLQIKATNESQKIGSLSGGNQQKALIARWLLTKSEILIFDEPTRGIDVASKAMIHDLISSLAVKGHSIIMVSSEMPEIVGMSDRIMVMHEGKVSGFLDRKEASQERIMTLAT